MNSVQIAQLLAQLLPLGIQLYNEILSANQNSGLKTLEQILAEADVNWKEIGTVAKQELG